MRTLLVLVALLVSAQANAVSAFLMSCVPNAASGQMIYIGTYGYAGGTFQMTFLSLCPNSVEVP